MHNHKDFPLWTALVTPLTSNDKIDFDSLKSLCHEQEKNKIGILILGSTGEALNLDLEEKKEIINFVTELNLKVPLMAGIGGHNVNETLSWLSFLEGKNIDAYLMVTPLYAKPGIMGQTNWFKTLMDKATRPCMLYNVPSRTGVQLHPEVIGHLKDHKNLWALKEASGDPTRTQKYHQEKNDLVVYCGDDGLMLDYAKNGAKGLVSVASNVWPQKTRKYVEDSLKEHVNNLEKFQKCFDALFIASNPVPAKFLLSYQKRIQSSKMRLPLDEADLIKKDVVLDADKLMQEL